MRYSLFFSLLILFCAYSKVQCGLIGRIFDVILDRIPPEPDEASLVLGVEEESGFAVIANVPILADKKDPKFQKYIFLCPAETKQEKKINEERSKTKNTLFIKETYGDLNLDETTSKNKKSDDRNDENVEDFKNYEYLEFDCQGIPKPSLRQIGSDDGIDLHFAGFEVFLEEKYKKLKVLNLAKAVQVDAPEFQWFNILIFRFDHAKGNALSVNAEFFNGKWTSVAPKYEFGEKTLDPKINRFGRDVFYEQDVDIESLYLPANQVIVFNRLFEDPEERNRFFNIAQKRHLVVNHLVPLDSFVSPLLEQAAHSYANIAAMWNVIKNGSWKRVEDQMRYLVQGILGMYLISGTHGTLTLNGKEVHLGSDETVRVPREFWKLVQYTRKVNQFYNMLIVTVNNPYENIPSELCPISQCKTFGWEYVEQEYHPMGRTACCTINEENIALLRLEKFVKPDRVLNLREVPHLEDEKLTLNITKYIQDIKKRPNLGPFLPSDSVEYRNQPDFVLESEKKKKVEDKKDDNFSMIGLATWIITNHALPYINSIMTKTTKLGLEEKSPFLQVAKDKIGKKKSLKEGFEEKSPFLNELNDEIDEKTLKQDGEKEHVDGKDASVKMNQSVESGQKSEKGMKRLDSFRSVVT